MIIGSSNKTKSAENELDELFGSIKVPSDNKINVSSSNKSGNIEQLDDCLPLFPTTNLNTNKTNKQSIFYLIFII